MRFINSNMDYTAVAQGRVLPTSSCPIRKPWNLKKTSVLLAKAATGAPKTAWAVAQVALLLCLGCWIIPRICCPFNPAAAAQKGTLMLSTTNLNLDFGHMSYLWPSDLQVCPKHWEKKLGFINQSMTVAFDMDAGATMSVIPQEPRPSYWHLALETVDKATG